MTTTPIPTAGSPAVEALGFDRPRITALDGLRGITIMLVVLGHLSSFLWPVEGLRSTPYLRGLVSGGAVPIFFIVSGFIVTTGLLRDEDRGRLDPVRFIARRLVRVGAQILPLCAAIVLVAAVDPTDTATTEATVNTVTHTLTYTNNWLYQLNPFGARPDMGHLWFLSVQQQWYLVLPFLVVALSTQRRLLTGLLVALAGASAWYRLSSVTGTSWYALSIDTFARADGLLLGAALAVALPRLRRLRSLAPTGGLLGLVAVFGLLMLHTELGPLAFLQSWSLAFVVAAAVLVAAVVLHERQSSLTWLLSARWLTWLGRASLVIYVWHYPVIFFVGRHAGGASWALQSVEVLAVVAVVTVVSNRWVEAPVRVWLRNHLQGTDRRSAPVPVAPPVVAP